MKTRDTDDTARTADALMSLALNQELARLKTEPGGNGRCAEIRVALAHLTDWMLRDVSVRARKVGGA